MPDTNTMTVTLTSEARDFIRRKVENGEYASPEDVVTEGIELLKLQVEDREHWEQNVLIPTYNRMMADPSSAISSQELQASLEEARRMRRKAS